MALLKKVSVVCIGAGPAGLTAGYLLTRDCQGARVTVLEQDESYVGGISRTVLYKGFCFDIGGHRFFSKSTEIEHLWDELLGEDFLLRPRKSRILYRGKLFDYPLRAFDALGKLGVSEALRCILSYLRVCLQPAKEPRNFEEWVTHHFGRRLFEIFFKTYTEKVWGMKCTEISADWAAQRIKGLSLFKAIWHALRPQAIASGERQDTIKTLVTQFHYPRRGPGMLWSAAAKRIEQQGGEVLLGQRVVELKDCGPGMGWEVTTRSGEGQERKFLCDHVISSMPLRSLGLILQPTLPETILQATNSLRYRDFLVVALIVRERHRFDDNWIYIHDPGVKVGRIQNFKSWSPDMVPDPALNCYGMEYFCFEGDGLWTATDAELVDLASQELIQLGLALPDEIVDGTVVRQPKAYPVYDEGYEERIGTIRDYLEAHCSTLHLVGRNGMHKYNNQDHAMMTALLTVKNILAGKRIFDVWQVNQDAEYHEEENSRHERCSGLPQEEGVEERHVPAKVSSR
ncbi:Monooxygenase, FAD-binding domain protein [mine drainage metagenome]|uniref:Monooxygenase, FAD-binding domain protein n=1 Tax=mine drainage metagenome TaxID=410659 RepID=T0YZT0_9ZZZZ